METLTAPAPPKVSPRRSLLTLVAALVLASAAFGSPRFAQSCAGPSATGQEAPDFRAPLVLNGPPAQGELALSELRGQAVVLDFWASWCGPCRAEAPILQRLHERYAREGLVVVGVNTKDEEGMAAIAAKRLKLTFPIVYDEGEAVARQYRVSGLPTLVVISKTGKIVAVRAGTTSESALEDLIRKALSS